MGITAKEYFENIYNALFSPLEFYNDDNMVVSTRQALGTVICVSVISLIGQGIADKSIFGTFYPVLFVFTILGIILLWFLTGLFLEYIAKIFTDESRLNKILFNTSFSMLPYIFFAPLDILKKSGDSGYSIGVICEMLLYFWIIFLDVLAIKKTYNISIARAFMMMSLPFISVFFALTWAISFFVKMGYINSI